MARPRTISDAALLGAARRVFTQQGAQAGARAVAEAAGISQTVLFQRFGTKEALFFAAMLPRPMNVDAILGALPEPGAPAARQHLLAIAARFFAEIRAALPGTLRGALHPAYPKALEAAHRTGGEESLLAALTTRLRVLQERGDLAANLDPLAAAEGLVALLHGLALGDVLGAGAPGPDGVERAVCQVWHGFVPGGAAG